MRGSLMLRGRLLHIVMIFLLPAFASLILTRVQPAIAGTDMPPASPEDPPQTDLPRYTPSRPEHAHLRAARRESRAWTSCQVDGTGTAGR